MNDWYVKYKLSKNIPVPVDPVNPIESILRPEGHYWGPYHCRECALICGNYGKTERQAWEFNHGTSDEKFACFLASD